MITVREAWKMECPHCGDDQRIDICASVWVRLCPDGTDTMAAANGDHEWDSASAAVCHTCGFAGTVRDFSTEERP